MSHQLFVKSLREPIAISKEEAEGIANLIADQSKDGRTPVVIEDVWSGTKGEVKFVKYPPRSEEREERKNIEPMTQVQADVFEKRIFPHIMEAEVSGFGSGAWQLFYMQKEGAIRLEVDIVAQVRKQKKIAGWQKNCRMKEIVTSPDMYVSLQKEIAAYKAYQAKKSYAEKKRLEHLEETAEQLSEV
jgi:hypothetical protein